MKPHFSDDARDFAEVATKAFAAAGGVDLARETELNPQLRTSKIAPLLAQLGADELDATADAETAEAAAALCREAGRVVLPYPVVSIMVGETPLGLVGSVGADALVDHGDLFESWRVASVDGSAALGSPTGQRLGTRLGPFAAPLVIESSTGADVTEAAIAMHLTLTSFVIAGALDEAVRQATAHVVDRVQFDKPLSAFQAVQFQLADAHVAVSAVDEMAQFALSRCHEAPSEAIADALGARLAAVDSARLVLRTTQQLHGAAGVCDEYDVSVIARHLQPALRLPFGAETTAARLADAIERVGFVGLFDHGGAR